MAENKKTILLVEDDDFLIDIYTVQFKKEGYNIDVAQSGEIALSKIKEQNPDLVLLDLVLPQISGWEVLRQIREDLTLPNLKVAILSNNMQKEDEEKYKNLGVIKYIPKTDFTPSEISEEIKKILK